MDGPGISVLDLPTRRLSALTTLTENGATVDVTRLDWSATGAVRKQSGSWWTDRYRGIVATIFYILGGGLAVVLFRHGLGLI